MTHQSLGNEVAQDGIVHRCSCGWVSRPCFSNMIASIEGQDHREAAGVTTSRRNTSSSSAPHAAEDSKND